MFEGVVYIGDSCCNTGVLVHQCHPDAEMPCQFKWEMYYESGDPAAVLRALLRDLGVEVKKLIILERKLKMAKIKLTVVIPVYNEKANIPILYKKLKDTLQKLSRRQKCNISCSSCFRLW